MESLAETPWDVTISGTGLAQSLLALALSRSGKKVLHVDRNPYYGGPEAAFSLQEAEDWAAQSQLLPTLVSSKVYRQLEFQAVGSWWIYKPSGEAVAGASTNGGPSVDLYRVPSSREDVFADDVMNVKSKRTLMRFLRHIAKPPQDDEVASEQEHLSGSFPEYLSSKFQVPSQLYDPLLSLSLAQASPSETSAEYAVARIKRHLTSIGVFGPGFGSLLAKWGGGSELAQVGCRALAVGGGVYVLDAGVKSVKGLDEPDSNNTHHVQVELSNEESIKTRVLVGSNWDLPADVLETPHCDKASRSITIVSSSLESLFPVTAEGGPIPAGAVVVFPGNVLGQKDDSPPVYILAHSSETGECPTGQSVLYSSVSIPGPDGQSLLEDAIHKLLQSSADSDARILWSLRYTQLGRASESMYDAQATQLSCPSTNILCFPPPSLDLAFDDRLIDVVKDAWKRIMGDDTPDEFMKFEDREGISDDAE